MNHIVLNIAAIGLPRSTTTVRPDRLKPLIVVEDRGGDLRCRKLPAALNPQPDQFQLAALMPFPRVGNAADAEAAISVGVLDATVAG